MVCYNSQNVGQVDTLSLSHGSRSVDKYNLRTSIITNTGATGGRRSALNCSNVNTGLGSHLCKITTQKTDIEGMFGLTKINRFLGVKYQLNIL